MAATTHVDAPLKCPACGALHDAHTGTTKRTPQDGDLSICIECGEFAVFTADAKLRTPDSMELLRHELGPYWRGALRVQREIKARKANP